MVSEHGEEYGKALGYFVGDTPYGYAIYNSEKDRITEFVFEKGIENAYHELVDENSSKLLPDNLELLNGLVVNEEDPFTYYLSDTEGNVVDNYGNYKQKKIKNKTKVKKVLGKNGKRKNMSTQALGPNKYGFMYESELPYFYAARYPKTFMANYSKNKLISLSEVYQNSSKGYACAIVAAVESLDMMNKLYKNKWEIYAELWNKCKTTSDGATYEDDFADGLTQYFKQHYNSIYKAYHAYRPSFSSLMYYVNYDWKSILHLFPQNTAGHSVALLGYYSFYFAQNK